MTGKASMYLSSNMTSPKNCVYFFHNPNEVSFVKSYQMNKSYLVHHERIIFIRKTKES